MYIYNGNNILVLIDLYLRLNVYNLKSIIIFLKKSIIFTYVKEKQIF